MAMDEAKSGLLSGAAAGSTFGPIGTAVGAVLGVFGGMRAKRKRRDAERNMRISNTNISMQIGRGTVSNIAKDRENIARSYTTNLAREKARVVAGGGTLDEETMQQIQGRVGGERDRLTAEVDLARERFEGSDAYGYIKEEYTHAFVGGRHGSGRRGIGYDNTTDYYTEEQRGELRNYDPRTNFYGDDEGPEVSDRMQAANRAYGESVGMSLDEFEISQFGTEEQKTEFQGVMDARIQEANRIYDDALAMDTLEVEARRQRESDY